MELAHEEGGAVKKIAIAFLLLSGCTSVIPPAARAQDSADRPLAAGMARVVLLRPDSACDSSVYPVVVDENGHFVAEMAQNSRMTIDMPAGDHMLVAWPSVDARVEKYPDVDPVGAARLHLKEGETRYIEAFIPTHTTARRGGITCWHITTFALRRLRTDDSDLADWLATTRPITMDRATGEAEIAQDPQSVQTHVASALRVIARDDQLRDERMRAQQSTDGENVATDSADTK